jgi:hypothetical protein
MKKLRIYRKDIMKNLKVVLIGALVIGITACVNGQMRRTVYGNGNVVKEDRSAGNFTGLKVSSGIDVYLKQGQKESITVETDENLQDYIITEIKNGVLNVYSDANIRRAERKRVYVTMEEITSARTTSAGDILGQTPIKTDNIELSASSAGNINMEVYASKVEIDISSSGDITLNGKADFMSARLSSAGDLNAYDLEVKEADLSASSAGDADVYVSEKLTARASSAGDINYRGNPRYIDAHSSSAGGIHKR